MKKLTEADLELENKEDNEIKKIVLNKMNQESDNKEVSLSVEESEKSSKDVKLEGLEVVSSQICNGSSSDSSNIVGKSEELLIKEPTTELEILDEGSVTSASQYIVSSTPKQDANRDAVTGVSVALVTIAENNIDLPEFQILLELVKTQLKQENITVNQENIMKIVKITMELIEKSPLKGLSQKEIAIKILNYLLNEANIDNESMEIISSFLDTNLISDTIDLIISATKGELNINKVTKVTESCFTKIRNNFSRCISKVKRTQENKI